MSRAVEDVDGRTVALTPREIAQEIVMDVLADEHQDRVDVFANYRAEIDRAEGLIRDALAEQVRALEAELVLLDEVCAIYALDETRFLNSGDEPFGSVPTDAGLKAREAGRRYAEREMADLAAVRAAWQAVLTDPGASEDDKHDARFAIEFAGYGEERLAPLLPIRTLAPGAQP